jgi:hypothetical protein
MTTTTGKINEPVKLTATEAGEWIQTKGITVNMRTRLDEKSMSFTPSQNGLYEFVRGNETFTVQVGDTTTPPVEPPVEPPIVEPPAAGTLLYNSDTDIDWASMDGKTITIGKPYGDPTKPGTKYIRMNASGSPRITFRASDKSLILEHDGDYGRAYIGVINYQSRVEAEIELDSCDNNASIKSRNMHQYNQYLRDTGQPEVTNPVGGVGNAWKCGQVVNDLEIYHGNQGDGLAEKALSPQLEAGKPFAIKFSQFDSTSAGKIHIIDELDRKDGQGFKVVNEGDVSAPSQFFDKAAFMEWSECWFRLNAKGGGKVIYRHIKIYAI